MISKVKCILIISFIVIFCGFILDGKEHNNIARFSSKIIMFHNFNIKQIPKGWHLINKEESVIGWIYEENGASLVIKIGRDLPKKIMSDEVYKNILTKQYLEANPQNKVINCYNASMWGKQFNFIKMKFLNEKYGLTELIIFYKRLGEKSYMGTISLPYKTNDVNGSIYPEYMKEMIDSITFNENPLSKDQTSE